jgi:phosphatidylethanolamine-binding protein (PEBP) family uncharacterized protein
VPRPLQLILLLAGLSNACYLEVSGQGPAADEAQSHPAVESAGAGPAVASPSAGPAVASASTGFDGGSAPGSASAGNPPRTASDDPSTAGRPEPVNDAGVAIATGDRPDAKMILSSSAFKEGDFIPPQYTCDGVNESPAFEWSQAPAETQSLVLVLTATTNVLGRLVPYTRWVIWGIPASRRSLPEAVAEGFSPVNVPAAHQVSNESDTSLSALGMAGTAGILDALPVGTFTGNGNPGADAGYAGRASDAGESGSAHAALDAGSAAPGLAGASSNANAGRRYHGPCSYGFPQTFEFVLYALGASPAYPSDRVFGLSTDSVASWLETNADVLARAGLTGLTP